MRRLLDIARLRLRSLFRGRQLDAELDRELRSHLEHQIEENIARGMPRDEARFAALRAFGGMARVEEEARDARGVSIIENVIRDLRYTLRGLARQPMLLVAATVSIALGVGGNLAVFTLARELLFAAPDARRPEELVQMEVSHGSHIDYQRWLDLEASGALAQVAGFSLDRQLNWLKGDAAVSIRPLFVTANFFDVTGIPLSHGRAFSAGEARAEVEPRVVVVSHAFWQRELSGAPDIAGQTLVLNGQSFTILGVLAPKLRSIVGFGISPGVYVPLNRTLVPEISTPRTALVKPLGRLKPGQTLAQGRAAVDAADRRLGRLTGDTLYAGVQQFSRAGGMPLPLSMVRIVGAFMALLALVSLLVLLIACANVAGLLIARATTRRQEVAVRLALGGTRARLVQQFLVEGFWLALLGTIAGLGLVLVFMRVMNQVTLPVALPIELNFAPNRAVLLFGLALAVLSTVLCALLPALGATRLALTPALKREATRYAGRRFTPRDALLVGQVTVSTLLLVTAILFVRNLARTHVTNPGFEVERALVAQIGFVAGGPRAERIGILERAAERLVALGAEDVAYSSAVPLTVHSGSSNGRQARFGDGEALHVEFQRSFVGPAYFATSGIRLLRGREFTTSDRVGAPPVVIVNEEFARRYLGAENPVGGRLRFADEKLELDIVGVAANSKHFTIGEQQRPALYQAFLQQAEIPDLAFVLARTRVDPGALVTAVRGAIGALDPSISVEVQPMRSTLAFALLPSRIGALVLGTLGALALVLAMFGLYAIVSYTVSRRVGEIAIRVALGATRERIVWLVMRDASMLVGLGVTLGLGIAALVTQPLAVFLVTGLSTTDPLSFVATAGAFVIISVAASWLPARHAMRVSPAIAMRLE